MLPLTFRKANTVFLGILAAAYDWILHETQCLAASLTGRLISGFSQLWAVLSVLCVPDSTSTEETTPRQPAQAHAQNRKRQPTARVNTSWMLPSWICSFLTRTHRTLRDFAVKWWRRRRIQHRAEIDLDAFGSVPFCFVCLLSVCCKFFINFSNSIICCHRPSTSEYSHTVPLVFNIFCTF